MITGPRDQRVTWICWRWPFILNHQSAKYDGHKSCWSRGIIQEGRKIYRYYYLITKYDNSISYAFWHISYKLWQVVITKCVRYCKVWQTLLESASGITKCDSYYKVRRSTYVDSLVWYFFHYDVKITRFWRALSIFKACEFDLCPVNATYAWSAAKVWRAMYEKLKLITHDISNAE